MSIKRNFKKIIVVLVLLFTFNTVAFGYDLTLTGISEIVAPLVNEEYRNVIVEEIRFSDLYNFTDAMTKQLSENGNSYYMEYDIANNYRNLYIFTGTVSVSTSASNMTINGNMKTFRSTSSTGTWTVLDASGITSKTVSTLETKHAITSNQTILTSLKTGMYIEDSSNGQVAYYEAFVTKGSIYLDTNGYLNFDSSYKRQTLNKWTGAVTNNILCSAGMYLPKRLCGSNYTIYNQGGQIYYRKDLNVSYQKQINIYPKDSSVSGVYKALDFYALSDTTITINEGSPYIQNYYSENRLLVDQRKQYWNIGQTYKIYKGNSIGFYNISSNLTNYIGIGYDQTKITVTQINPSNIASLYTLTPPTNPNTGDYTVTPTPSGSDPNGNGGGMTGGGTGGSGGGGGGGFTDPNAIGNAPQRSSYPDGVLGSVEYGFATLMYYIGIPFRYIGEILKSILSWLSQSISWITQISTFLTAIFGFLPKEIVGAMVMIVSVSTVFAIIKIFRG